MDRIQIQQLLDTVPYGRANAIIKDNRMWDFDNDPSYYWFRTVAMVSCSPDYTYDDYYGHINFWATSCLHAHTQIETFSISDFFWYDEPEEHDHLATFTIISTDNNGTTFDDKGRYEEVIRPPTVATDDLIVYRV